MTNWLSPLLSPEELGASDRHAAELGTPGFTLMLRAGRALATAAAAALPSGRIAVLCGPGNNGGDGLVAAQALHEAGREVLVLLTRAAESYRGDAALARDATEVPTHAFSPELLRTATGAIDALLGTGATGPARGAELAAIEALVEAGLPVVACDVPSGTNAATGAVEGPAVGAIRTVTFHRPSPGHLVRPAKGHVGTLQVVDIGIPAGAPIEPQTSALRDAVLRALPGRGGDSHKYAAGAVVVLAGGEKYPGAGLLAVRGAQRAGAGYVTAVVSEPAVPLVRAAAPEAIVRPFPDR
ncbi:MAG: NAD(P)H-hydrate epimerase, partial [Solirubrobacteraceae bacterium]|nr:NAD(P)H-hydrate epimerase [Solirubrobacteraceae bacterium]